MHEKLRTKFLRAKIKKRKTKSGVEDREVAVKLSREVIKDLIAEAIQKNNFQNGIDGNPSNVTSFPDL